VPPPPVGSNLFVQGRKVLSSEEEISKPAPIILPTNPPVVVEVKSNPPPTIVSNMARVVPLQTNAGPVANSVQTNRLIVAASTPTNPPVVAATRESAGNEKTFWIAVTTAIVAALALVWLVVRRVRSQAKVSLITQSLERDKK